MSNWMRLKIPATVENVGLARVAVAAFAAQMDYAAPDLEDIRVAVAEAVSNAAQHAYPDSTGDVEIEAIVETTGLIIRVRDCGRGIHDLRQARRLGNSSAGRGGIGFSFMETLMDGLEIDSKPGCGTTVTMNKAAPARPDSRGWGEDKSTS